jgi:THO complex subunit 4
VDISYGPNGQSRGIANIVFNKNDGASKAVAALNGLLVDGRPMKIEVLVDASQAPAIVAPRGLGDRIAQPKVQPKSAAATKAGANTAAASTRGKAGKRGRGGRARPARPAKKTAEELDSEMADYFDATAAPAAEAAAPAATNGDAPMDDEIL